MVSDIHETSSRVSLIKYKYKMKQKYRKNIILVAYFLKIHVLDQLFQQVITISQVYPGKSGKSNVSYILWLSVPRR